MLLHEVADVSAAVAGTTSRTAKIRLLAECLRRVDDAHDATIVSTYLTGELRQRRTGLGYAALRDLPPPAESPSLTVAEVDALFDQVSGMQGAGSTAARRAAFTGLMVRATANEQRLLAGLVSGELRQGAQHGVLTDAVAQASGLDPSDVRRAVTVAGSLVPVAAAVLIDAAGLSAFRLSVGTPLRPMLAAPASSMAAAFDRVGAAGAGVEWKLDGIRVQVHRGPDGVTVYTRTLDDITDRVPEIVELAAALPVSSAVLDGEAIALDGDGRPLPFQRTASRTARRVDVGAARATTPLSVFFFDCLSLDGTDLIGEPAQVRWDALAGVVPAENLTPRLVTTEVDRAAAFFDEALAAGHEGVVVKDLGADYQAGRRGASWQKVKPRHTLDLAVIAVEWGHGRRKGWLSNVHLAARDADDADRWIPVGKTFKGMTDQMLAWQTARFQELKTHEDDWTVHVRPEQVVEVAFDGIQRSTRYAGGVALRFARVLRYRDDKTAAEADTIDTIRALL